MDATHAPGDPLPRADERLVAIVGAFGSGKTEVTVNLALARARDLEREELQRAAGGLPLPGGFPGLG